MAAVALAGLWAQTFLLTGVALDAMRGRRPTREACVRHWREGATKGARLQRRVHAAGAGCGRWSADTPCGDGLLDVGAAGVGDPAGRRCCFRWPRRSSRASTAAHRSSPPAGECRRSRSAIGAGSSSASASVSRCRSTCRRSAPAPAFCSAPRRRAGLCGHRPAARSAGRSARATPAAADLAASMRWAACWAASSAGPSPGISTPPRSA